MTPTKLMATLALISSVAAAQAQEAQRRTERSALPDEVQLIPAPAHIAADVDAAADGFAKAATMAPGVMLTAMSGFQKQGLRWFFYGDRKTEQEANQLGRVIGGALASLASALRNDMVQSSRASLQRR